jgi:hypothetical protein
MGVFGKITGVVTVYNDFSDFADNPSKNWDKGFEGAVQLGLILTPGYEEAETVWGITTTTYNKLYRNESIIAP